MALCMYNIYYSQHRLERSSQEMWPNILHLGEVHYCKGGGQEAGPLTPKNGIILIVHIYRKSAGGPGLTRRRINIINHDLSYNLNEHITAQRTVNIDPQYSHSCCINHYCRYITMIHKPIISSLAIIFFAMNSWLLLIKGKLTVQVTSKGLCSSVSFLVNNESGSKHGWIATLAPPPLLWSPCPGSGAPVTGKGAGPLLVNSQIICSGGGFPRLWSIPIWQGTVTSGWVTLHFKGNTPASAFEPECSVFVWQRGWRRGRDDPWERSYRLGGGVGEPCVQVKQLASPPFIKNRGPLDLKNYPHLALFFWHAAIIMHLWSAALSRIDSRWKECTLARHTHVF